MHLFLSGGVFVACLAIAAIFARLYRRTNDQLFVYFAAAFAILAVERILLANFSPESEYHPYVYLVRLIAYLSILWGIVDKNRRG